MGKDTRNNYNNMVTIINKDNPNNTYYGVMQRYDFESFLFSFEISNGIWTAETLLYFDEWTIASL